MSVYSTRRKPSTRRKKQPNTKKSTSPSVSRSGGDLPMAKHAYFHSAAAGMERAANFDSLRSANNLKRTLQTKRGQRVTTPTRTRSWGSVKKPITGAKKK